MQAVEPGETWPSRRDLHAINMSSAFVIAVREYRLMPDY